MSNNAYRIIAKETIDKVLSWHGVTDAHSLESLDPGCRLLVKKDLECNCPFERRGLPYRIWESELRLLFGIEMRQPELAPRGRSAQQGLFG